MNEKGQLIFPIIAVLFLFGLFWIPYVRRCQEMYWTMRMDAAADLVALSADRQRAMLLNTMATLQTLQSPLLPRIKGYGIMDLSMRNQFEGLNRILRTTEKSFKPLILSVATQVARLNGSRTPVGPLGENFASHLEPQAVRVTFLADGIPVASYLYKEAYFTRSWSPRKLKAQPIHTSHWLVCKGTICGQGRAKLWLDVEPDSVLNNGGFPPVNASLLRSVGFQCFYPQFNATLVAKS